MKKLSFIMVAACALATAPACKKKVGAADALAKLETAKTDMCNCKDAACADKVNKDFERWDSKSKEDKNDKMTEEDTKQAGDLLQQYATCMQTAKGGGAAPATPPATPPAEAPPATGEGSAAAPAEGAH